MKARLVPQVVTNKQPGADEVSGQGTGVSVDSVARQQPPAAPRVASTAFSDEAVAAPRPEVHTPQVVADVGYGAGPTLPTWAELMAGRSFVATPTLETATMKLDPQFNELRERGDYRNYQGRTLSTLDGLSHGRMANTVAQALTTAFGGDPERLDLGTAQHFGAGPVTVTFRPGQHNEVGYVTVSAGNPRGENTVPPTLARDEALATLEKARGVLHGLGFQGGGDTLTLRGPEVTFAPLTDVLGPALELKRTDGQPFTPEQKNHLFDKLENIIEGHDAIGFRNSEDVIRVSFGARGRGMSSIIIVKDVNDKVLLRAGTPDDQRFVEQLLRELFP